MKWISISLLFFCISCQSKPTRTQTEHPDFIEIRAEVRTSPRPNAEIESGFLLDHDLQNCLRDALKLGQKDFSLVLKGALTARGELKEGSVTTPDKGLRDCLARPMNSVNFGNGRPGPLEVEILIGPPLDG